MWSAGAGGAADILEEVNVMASIAKSAEMVGGSRAAIDISAAYAKEREQYGRSIGSFQAIQHYMADMLLAYDSSAAFLYKAAGIVDKGGDVSREASVLTAWINEKYKFISERAVQIHGGIGTTRECNIGLFYRKAKACEYIAGGPGLPLRKNGAIADRLKPRSRINQERIWFTSMLIIRLRALWGS